MAEKVKGLCERCGQVYEGGPYSHYCRPCYRQILGDAARWRKLNEIGGAAFAAKCAEERAKKERRKSEERAKKGKVKK